MATAEPGRASAGRTAGPGPERSEAQSAAEGLLRELEALLVARRADPPSGSYSATLLRDPERATRKIMEEAYELCVELGRPEVQPGRTAEEAADLLFHVLAGLVGAGVALDDVIAELAARRGTRREERP